MDTRYGHQLWATGSGERREAYKPPFESQVVIPNSPTSEQVEQPRQLPPGHQAITVDHNQV